jgi:signal transduction histidine kinase/DNA-binding response OmpR family regulator
MRIVFLTVGFAIALNLSAQESRQELTPQDIWQAGLPYIAQYTPEDYRAHVQNWDFIQDGNGILYVGNTSGILEFDGVSWRLLAFPNGSPAKSFAKSNDNIIYVGAVRDFGYLQPDSVGLMQFHSLLSQLDTAYHNFADIWFTYAIGDAVYFISDAYIFRWQENKFKVWEAEEGFGFASQVNDQLYIDKKGTGLMRMQDDSLVLIPDGDKFLTRKGSITIMLPYEGDKILMGHFYEGLFLYDHQTISPFKAEKNPLQDRHIYSGLALPSGHFVFATHGQGCFIVDVQGKVIQWLNKKSGLNSNVIIGCYTDSEGSLWLATESGINRVEISSPLRLFGPAQGLGEGTDRITYYNGKLFAATKNGLFYLKETSADPERKEFRFQKIEGTDHQTWDVTVKNNYLLAGNYSGLYQVDPAFTVRQLLPDNTSDLCPSLSDTNRIYTGTMTGKLFAIKFTNGRWQIENQSASVEGRIIRIEEDTDGSVWISTRYNGVYKLDWSPSNTNKSFGNGYSIKHFTTTDGLPEISYNVVYRVNDEIFFSTQAGIYQFDGENQKFTQDTELMRQWHSVASGFGHLMEASAGGGVWITGGSEFDNKVYKFNNGIGREITAIKRFSNFSIIDIYELNDIVFLSGIKGIVGYHQRQGNNYSTGFPVCIRKVLTSNDSLLFGGNRSSQPSDAALSLPFQNNHLRFAFALPDYDRPEANQYQYYLDGFDKDWSSWTTETQRDFTNLPEGDYRFRVRGRNVYGQVSEERAFAFTILPPWYRAWWAYLLYALTATAIVGLTGRWRSDRLRRDKAELEIIVKERTRQLEQQAKQLKEMDKMKSSLFANISHEFRTPLTLIKGPVSELLKTENGTLRLSDAKMIDRNANRLMQLVNQLLDLSKLDAGNLTFEPQAGDINQFLRALASAFSSHAEQRSMAYRIAIPEDIRYAAFDHDKVEKIVYNLLSNAFKFTPDHGQVTIKAAHEKEQLKLTLVDSGCGIPAEKLPNIFDRFFQADNSETREQEGTGIGLALTRELTQLMGGTISVQSTAGAGSFFTVTLPMRSTDPGRETWAPELKPAGTVSPSRVSEEEILSPNLNLSEETPVVLVVEDNTDMRSFIKEQLAWEYKILEARHGQLGLDIARQEIPDLIVTDLMMPRMDGIDLCEQLKTDERTSHIPVIILTARAGQEQKLEGLKTGADDYLTKPFDRQELLARVNNLIVQRRKLRERFSREVILEPRQTAITSMEEKFLQKIMDNLEENLSDPAFGPPQLQDMLSMSKTQFYRKMKALTDQSPGEFIRNYRLKRAAQILSKKGENVTQVAYAVGFNNLSYFAKCFKELHGVIPSEYKGQR